MREVELPKAQLLIERRQVASVMASILDAYAVEDIAVEDPPLEDVIAEVFAGVEQANGAPSS